MVKITSDQGLNMRLLKHYTRKVLNFLIGWPTMLNLNKYMTSAGTFDRSKVTDIHLSGDGYILVIEGRLFPVKNTPRLKTLIQNSGFVVNALVYEELEEGGLTYDLKRNNFVEGKHLK